MHGMSRARRQHEPSVGPCPAGGEHEWPLDTPEGRSCAKCGLTVNRAIEVKVHTVPALDTGLGRAAGYASDAELFAAAAAQRAALPPMLRAALDQAERELDRAVLGL